MTALAAPGAREAGLVDDAVALWSRATRQRRRWAPHEARCHAVVDRAIAGLRRRRSVFVLGSGLLRDVPLDRLAATFQRVVLVDAVHLLPARRRARRAGAEIVAADLAGLYAGDAAGGTPSVLAALASDAQIDLVVSANVLSQLPMAAEDWAEARGLAPETVADGVTRLHLAELSAFRCRVCLLTDVEHRVEGADGAVLRRTDLLRGASLPPPDEAWDWVVAPPGEIARGETHVHRVHAHADLPPLGPEATSAARPPTSVP